MRRVQREPIFPEGDDDDDEGLFDYVEGTAVQGEVVSNDKDDADDSIAPSRRSSRSPSRPSSRPSSRPGSRYGTPRRRRASSGNLSLAESEDSGWAEMGIVGGPTRNTDRYDDNVTTVMQASCLQIHVFLGCLPFLFFFVCFRTNISWTPYVIILVFHFISNLLIDDRYHLYRRTQQPTTLD